MDSKILVEQHDGVLTIQINRPEKKNALTQSMYQDLNHALDELSKNPEIFVCVIFGSQGNFTSGNDLQDFIQCQTPDDLKDVTQFLSRTAQISKPLIAAVEGFAVGIGTTLLAHCDLVYASKDARFQTPFVNLGLSPEAGSSLLFPKLMGYQRAAECLLLGEPFSCDKAYELGLVTQIIDPNPIEFAMQQARTLEKQPHQALLTAKQLLRHHDAQALCATIERENNALFGLLNSEEAKAQIASTFQKIKS